MGEPKMEKTIGKKELSEQLGMCVRSIDRAMKEGGLPYYKIGSAVKFRVSEVEKWMKERKVING